MSSNLHFAAILLATLLIVPGAAFAPAAADDDCLLVENFAKATVGEFPADWRVRKDAAKKAYSVKEEDGRRFLHAHAEGLGMQAARQFEWNLDEYPVLAWRWRPVDFPKDSDERESGRNDSALAVYMLVPYSTIRGPQAVKYIWSEKVPVGTALESNFGLTKARVLRSGKPAAGEWTEERVNVREDFRTAFAPSETPKPAGVAVLTDSDDTGSTATGQYADFRVCRR